MVKEITMKIKRIWNHAIRYLRIKAAIWGIIPISLTTMLKLVYSDLIVDQISNKKYNPLCRRVPKRPGSNQGQGYKFYIKYER